VTTQQQIATREPRTNAEAVCLTLAKPEMRDRIKAALPPGVDPDRFVRVTLTAIQQNPKIADGDRQSLYNAAIRAAADGLVPDGREGAFVDMGGKVTWFPMVGGIIKRLATAGINIDAQVVYENDEFEQQLGDDAAIHHKAPKLGQPRGKYLGVYAIARLPNGMVMREVMDVDQVEQVRNASRSKNNGPWKDWWTEMARKTVIRRLAKRLPILDPHVAETIQRDDELYDFAAGNAGAGDTAPETAQEAQQQASSPRRPRGLDKVAAAASASPASTGDVIDGEVIEPADENEARFHDGEVPPQPVPDF
jgi:recombination protein RecT